MKAPEVTLDKILGGLQKVLAQLEKHQVVTDKYIADRDAQIAELQRRRDVAKQVGERSAAVTKNLKSLLVVD